MTEDGKPINESNMYCHCRHNVQENCPPKKTQAIIFPLRRAKIESRTIC